MARVVTRTLGPLHFEDLEPKRFEDLVRELIYELKDWQSIEATGRSGSDDGFDIRAYERVSQPGTEREDGESAEDDEAPHPMEGNLWMFQCKREAEVGPTKVAQIIEDGVKADNPPYGYVLAAPANFSKKSFDLFREELRKRGVMEFYLWGRAALEDMLHLPINDRILFTFFGISLAIRRRSRATDIRAIVSRKNKLLRILGEEPSHEPILIRDTKDTHYPHNDHYRDFDKKARWRVYKVIDLDPRGLILRVSEHFAYLDLALREWDMTDALNLARSQEELSQQERGSRRDLHDRIDAFWHFLPRANRATFVRNGLIKFEDIAVIDDKGDSEFRFPHIYVDFHETRGPFLGFAEYLRIHDRRHESLDGLKRVDRFPHVFDAPRIGTIHGDRTLKVDERVRRIVEASNESFNTLYAVDDRYDFLAEADVITVEKSRDEGRRSGEPTLIQITNKRTKVGKDSLDSLMDDPGLNHRVLEQIGREVTDTDQLRILEFKVTHEWAIKRSQPPAGDPQGPREV
jgi:hypothetical protein